MKEATGELNLTVVVVISVGILVAFFYFTIWPLLQNNFESKTSCDKAICEKCTSVQGCKTVQCYSKDNPNNKFDCVYKG